MRDLRDLPKAHLHLHLTGSMRPGTVRELAAEHAVRLPPELIDDDRDPWRAQRRDWSYFQRLYNAARSTIRTPADLDRVIEEAAADDAADGTVWLELQVNPGSYAAQFGLQLDHAVQRLLDACHAAEEATGVGIGLIIAANWTAAPTAAVELARVAVSFAGRGVVGFGIADDDSLGRPADFVDAFRVARQAGLIVSPHSGFYAGPEHVRACVEFGAQRIGHGVAATHDVRLLEQLSREHVTLELCPGAYPPLGVVPTLADVPLRQLYVAGVPVALGTDDPLLFGVSLLDQYRIAREVLGLDDKVLAELARQSVRACTASESERAGWLSAIDAWLSTPDS
jgi:adenosine deaminase